MSTANDSLKSHEPQLAECLASKFGCSNSVKLSKYNAAPIGGGSPQTLFRFTDVRWSAEQEKMPKSFVLQLVPDPNNDLLKIAYQRGMKFCQRLSSTKMLPQCLTRANDSSFFVFTDYLINAAHVWPERRLELSEVLQVTKLLAKLHVNSMGNEDLVGEILYQTRNYGTQKAKSLQMNTGFDIMEGLRQLLALCNDQNQHQLHENVPVEFLSQTGKLRAPASDIDTLMWAMSAHQEAEMCDVFVHGALTHEHLVLANDSEGQQTDKVMVIDGWQSIHMGNPMFDLCCLINASSNSEIRRQHLDFVFDTYKQAIGEEIKKQQSNTDDNTSPVDLCPFSTEQLQYSYKAVEKYAMLLGLALIPSKLETLRSQKSRLNNNDKDEFENAEYEVIVLLSELLEDFYALLEQEEFMQYVQGQGM